MRAPELDEKGLLTSLLDASVDGILAFDRECRYTAWNGGEPNDLGGLENRAPDPLSLKSVAGSLVYASDARHLRWTMVDGKTVFANGRARSIDVAALRRDLPRLQKLVLKKSGVRL